MRSLNCVLCVYYALHRGPVISTLDSRLPKLGRADYSFRVPCCYCTTGNCVQVNMSNSTATPSYSTRAGTVIEYHTAYPQESWRVPTSPCVQVMSKNFTTQFFVCNIYDLVFLIKKFG